MVRSNHCGSSQPYVYDIPERLLADGIDEAMDSSARALTLRLPPRGSASLTSKFSLRPPFFHPPE
jgi:hypothetical protein